VGHNCQLLSKKKQRLFLIFFYSSFFFFSPHSRLGEPIRSGRSGETWRARPAELAPTALCLRSMWVLCSVSMESAGSSFKRHGDRRRNCSGEQLPPEEAPPWQEEYPRSTREPRPISPATPSSSTSSTRPSRRASIFIESGRDARESEAVGSGRRRRRRDRPGRDWPGVGAGDLGQERAAASSGSSGRRRARPVAGGGELGQLRARRHRPGNGGGEHGQGGRRCELDQGGRRRAGRAVARAAAV
jgi:hypothetical protein